MRVRGSYQRGFTLVELAIVLVIIGIILGAVLKGQELIFNAKVKRLQSQMKEMVAAVYTYYDKYGYYPGDDPTASSRWTGAPNGDGNGIVTVRYCDDPNGAEEPCYLWRHLRYANIITGDPAESNPARLVPKHAFGGPVDIFYDNGIGIASYWISFRALPGDVAAAFDRYADDGKCNGGSVRAFNGTCASNGTYNSTAFYDIWVSF